MKTMAGRCQTHPLSIRLLEGDEPQKSLPTPLLSDFCLVVEEGHKQTFSKEMTSFTTK